MISLRSGLCILASTGVSLQKVVPLGIQSKNSKNKIFAPRDQIQAELFLGLSIRIQNSMYVYLISPSIVWLRDLPAGLVSSKSQRTASWDFDVQASGFMARRR